MTKALRPESRPPPDARVITIRGAREHNLKNVDVEIPRDRLVVFTGLSGSGKSSLAFDTIYAEGQRRYVESLSAYARQFLEMMQKPDVDQIDGLSPAISIEQKTTSKQPALDRRHRHRDLRLYAPAVGAGRRALFARDRACRSRARPSRRWSTACWRCPKARGCICWRRSCAAARANTARSSPSTSRRASSASRSTASSTRSAEAPALDKKFKHDIDVVVDRIVVRPDIGHRLAESFETALKLAEGLAVVEFADARLRSHLSPRGGGRPRSASGGGEAAEDDRIRHHPRAIRPSPQGREASTK